MWTQEMRDKAAATRLATKQRKAEASLRGMFAKQWFGKGCESTTVAVSEGVAHEQEPAKENTLLCESEREAGAIAEFDWDNAPLEECVQKASDLKKEYDRVTAIIVQRRNPRNQFRWRCWTQLHIEEVPAGLKYNGETVRSKCLKGGDGITQLPKFTDNGNFVVKDGVRVLEPIHCCNFLCYSVYQSKRVRQKVEVGV